MLNETMNVYVNTVASRLRSFCSHKYIASVSVYSSFL